MPETRPNEKTKQAERDDAQVKAGADREPTPREEAIADELPEIDPAVAEAYEEMTEKGANQKGEGRIG